MRLNPNQSASTNLIVQAIFKASRSLTRDLGEIENLQVSRKGAKDFVSNADLAAERILIKELQRSQPDYNILSEEAGYIQGKEKCPYTWVIDPLDGTTNFLHGLPHFCISVALKKHNTVLSGVIYDPMRDELFWAEDGAGAFLNNKRLHVSQRNNIKDALILGNLTPIGPPGESYQEALNFLRKHCQKWRTLGSSALNLAYIAAGRGEIAIDFCSQEWDIAAGSLFIREAGGFFKVLENDSKGNVTLATNRFLAEGVETIFTRAKKTTP